MACNYAKHAAQTRTVLLLDEVGLAEHSPDLPLKVLHGILVDPPIAVVGISNWALDAAKMNRAVCLQRPEPREADLQATGEAIVHAATADAAPAAYREGHVAADVGATQRTADEEELVLPPPPVLLRPTSLPSEALSAVLGPLAAAYHAVYTRQRELSGGRDFVGMRDYYSLLKVETTHAHPPKQLDATNSSRALATRTILEHSFYDNTAFKKICLCFH